MQSSIELKNHQDEKDINSLNIKTNCQEVDAQFNLAITLFNKEQYAEAFIWFQKAAEKNHSEAMAYIGLCYREGKGIEKNQDQAFHFFLKSSEQNNGKGHVGLAACYEEGLGTPIDYNKAVEYYEKAATKESNQAAFYLGEIFFEGRKGIIAQNYSHALKWYKVYISNFKQKSTSDLNIALYRIALCYENGWGVSKNIKIAYEYYLKAAKQGHSESQFEIGAGHYSGEVLQKNYKEAIFWLEKAAHGGIKKALSHIGFCYQNGDFGITRDLQEALKWYQQAANNNDPGGYWGLGIFYMKGLAVKPDLKKSLSFLEQAVKQNYPFGYYALGIFYDEEKEYKNENKAIYYYKKASTLGVPYATKALGKLYANKSPITKENLQLALYWFNKAKEQKQNVDAEISQTLRKIETQMKNELTNTDAQGDKRIHKLDDLLNQSFHQQQEFIKTLIKTLHDLEMRLAKMEETYDPSVNSQLKGCSDLVQGWILESCYTHNREVMKKLIGESEKLQFYFIVFFSLLSGALKGCQAAISHFGGHGKRFKSEHFATILEKINSYLHIPIVLMPFEITADSIKLSNYAIKNQQAQIIAHFFGNHADRADEFICDLVRTLTLARMKEIESLPEKFNLPISVACSIKNAMLADYCNHPVGAQAQTDFQKLIDLIIYQTVKPSDKIANIINVMLCQKQYKINTSPEYKTIQPIKIGQKSSSFFQTQIKENKENKSNNANDDTIRIMARKIELLENEVKDLRESRCVIL